MPDDNDPTGGAPNPTPNTNQPGDLNTLPQWARDAISRANNEAAKFRTERNEFRDQATAHLTEVDRVKGELATVKDTAAKAALQSVKLEVALAAGIPGENAAAFAARLQGTTKEELEADAKDLTGVFPTEVVSSATDPSQGRGADTPLTPEDAFKGTIAGLLGPMINR